jgi:kanamycin kinase
VVGISYFASENTAVPECVRQLASGERITPVWVNGDGGITSQIGAGSARRFAKWVPTRLAPRLVAEAARLRWAIDFVRVPRVLDTGHDSTGSWLLTAGLTGDSAIADRWKAAPAHAVRIAATALRDFHDALPVESCPFDWSVESRLAEARVAGTTSPLVDVPRPAIDRLVVCHGDACVPNTLIDDAGTSSGLVDLGSLGRADRWADLAVATWSTEWNYGPGWTGVYLAAYGVQPDDERTRYYRALWDLINPV